jgi:hypothetical protein
VTTEVKVYGHRWSAGKWVEQETGEGGNREPGGGTGGAGYGKVGDVET